VCPGPTVRTMLLIPSLTCIPDPLLSSSPSTLQRLPQASPYQVMSFTPTTLDDLFPPQ
jgi:hypothetical protein